MNYRWRSTIFLVFTAAFLITAPLVVLYTAGYRYQFGSTQIVKTGIVSVSSFPKNAKIFLNGKEQSKTSDFVIDNLRPGETIVRLEKDGYHPFEKNLLVKSGDTTFLKDVVLFLKNEVKEYFDKNNVSDVLPKDDSAFSYSVKNGAWQEVWITDGPFGSERFLTKVRHNPGADYELSWSLNREYLMLKETAGWRQKYVVVELRSKDVVPVAIGPSELASWDTGSSQRLFIKSTAGIRYSDLTTKKTTPVSIEADSIQTSEDGFSIVQTRNDKSIVSYINESKIASILAYLPTGDYEFRESAAGRILLEDPANNKIVLLDEHNTHNPILLNTEASIWKWSKDKSEIAFSNGFDLNIYSLHSHQTETLTRFSEPVTEIAWYPIGEVLFFSQADRIVSIERDQRDKRNQLELASNIQTKKIWFEKDGSKLMILGSRDSLPQTIFEKELQK
jgi:hypothetical protein